MKDDIPTVNLDEQYKFVDSFENHIENDLERIFRGECLWEPRCNTEYSVLVWNRGFFLQKTHRF